MAVVGEDLLQPGRKATDRPVPGQVLQVGDGEEGVYGLGRRGVTVVVLLNGTEALDWRVTGNLDDVGLLAAHDLHGARPAVVVEEGDPGGGHEAHPAPFKRLAQGSERCGVEPGVLVGDRIAEPAVVLVGFRDVANRRPHRPSLAVGATLSPHRSSSRALTAGTPARYPGAATRHRRPGQRPSSELVLRDDDHIRLARDKVSKGPVGAV